MKIVTITALTFASFLVIIPLTSQKVKASCAMTDVSFQVAIRGSHTPAQQTNNVGMGVDGNCWGNATTNTSTQVYTGAGTVDQVRNSSHLVGGSPAQPYGITGPVVGTQINVPIDIYSPAHDPQFMNQTTGHGYYR